MRSKLTVMLVVVAPSASRRRHYTLSGRTGVDDLR